MNYNYPCGCFQIIDRYVGSGKNCQKCATQQDKDRALYLEITIIKIKENKMMFINT
jgi:hypothetical protein